MKQLRMEQPWRQRRFPHQTENLQRIIVAGYTGAAAAAACLRVPLETGRLPSVSDACWEADESGSGAKKIR